MLVVKYETGVITLILPSNNKLKSVSVGMENKYNLNLGIRKKMTLR